MRKGRGVLQQEEWEDEGGTKGYSNTRMSGTAARSSRVCHDSSTHVHKKRRGYGQIGGLQKSDGAGCRQRVGRSEGEKERRSECGMSSSTTA